MLRVEYFGSCRIATPLRDLAASGLLSLSAGRNYGFVHSAPEILQQVKFADGGAFPSPELQHFLAPNSDLSNLNSAKTDAPDIQVIELSSAKSYWFGACALQANYVIRHFEERLPKPKFDEFRKALRTENTCAFAKANKNILSDLDAKVLQGLTVTYTDKVDLHRMLQLVSKRAEKTVIVPHINALGEDGLPLASRNAFRKQVLAVANDLALPVFDPTEMMEAVGQSQTMADNSAGLAHFTKDFTNLWGYLFAKRHLNECPEPPELHSAWNAVLKIEAVAPSNSARDILNIWRSTTNGAPLPARVIRACADTSSLSDSETEDILRTADHASPRELAQLWRRGQNAPFPTSWSHSMRRSVLRELSIDEVIALPDHYLDCVDDVLIQHLWSKYLETDPHPRARFHTLTQLSKIRPLPDRLLKQETSALIRLAKNNVEHGDLELAKWFGTLEIEGVKVPPEVHLYAARLAYFHEDWVLCIEQGLIALRGLPENRGGWIRLGRAAKALNLPEIEDHVANNIARLDGAAG